MSPSKTSESTDIPTTDTADPAHVARPARALEDAPLPTQLNTVRDAAGDDAPITVIDTATITPVGGDHVAHLGEGRQFLRAEIGGGGAGGGGTALGQLV